MSRSNASGDTQAGVEVDPAQYTDDILAAVNAAIDLVDVVAKTRSLRVQLGGGFGDALPQINHLPSTFAEAERKIRPLLGEFILVTHDTVELANESGETAHEVALSLADRTIRLLLLAIEMRQPLDQATRQMLDDLRAARDLPDFDFDDNPADRSRLAELARFVGNAPHGDFEKLKTLLKREAHEVVKWRARAERRQNTLDDNDSFSPCELRQLIGVSANRLNIYAKAAGVKTPGRGKKNFRYTREDAITVLKHVRKTATEDTVREQCIAALRDRFEITS